jgi:hypothetical protein
MRAQSEACSGPSQAPNTKDRFVAACSAQLSAPGQSLTAAKLDLCSNATRAMACDSQEVPAACKPEAGALTDGSACVDHGQCKSGLCEGNGGSQCGKCAALQPAGASCEGGGGCARGTTCTFRDGKSTCEPTKELNEGATCGGAEEGRCTQGLQCDPSTQKCVKPAKKGEACGGDGGRFCGYNLTCVAGKCADRIAEGGSCDPTGTADSADCAAHLACDEDTKKCVKLTVAAPGQACGKYVDCANGSCPTSYADGKTIYGKCPAMLPDGAACDPNSSDAVCDAYATCFKGTCQIMQASSCN